MKRILIATGVAVMALASVAGAQSYQYNTNLTVGSTGPDVVALQTALMSMGYDIPAISSGAASTGYFGSQTKTAVMAYQAAHGIPNTGFVGPLTRGSLNSGAMAGGSTSASCPAGYTCTPVNPAPVAVTCPVGYTCTPVSGGTPVTGTVSGVSTPGVAGTLSVSLWSTPSNGTTVYKGQAYDIVTYKIQAGASDMLVQNIAVDFDNRLWLYAGSITVKDDTGAVIGQVNGLNASNFTELTVGSDYRMTIPVSNYVVKAASTHYLTVNISFLASSDRTTDETSLAVNRFQVRSVDGTGVTDTETVGDGTDTGSNYRTYAWQGSTTGSVVVTTDASSPLQSLVQISTSGQTADVPLAVYDIKSQNAPGTLQSMTIAVRTNGVASVSSLFSKFTIKSAGLTYNASSIGAGTNDTSASSTVAFTNLQIPLQADVYTPLTIYGTVAADTSNALDGAIASTTWLVGGSSGGSSNAPVVIDQTYTNMAVTTGSFVSSDLTFSAKSAALTNLSASVDDTSCQSTSDNTTCSATVHMSYTLTAGDSSLFISKTPALALSTTTSGYTSANSASSTLTDVIANPSSLAGDTSASYVIPAGGSRTFSYTGVMKPGGPTPGLKTMSITAVNYGTASGSSSDHASSIDYNLGDLKVSKSI